MNPSPVIVVGAGPAGASLALLLARRGVRTTLVEASRSFQRTFRGQALMPSGLEAIARMDLSGTLQALPHETLDAWEFWIEGKRLFRVEEPIEPSGPPCTLVSQPEFLTALVEQARQFEHFEFLQGSAVQDLMWEQQRVVGVQLSDGQRLSASLVVATDGRGSTLRQKAGLSLRALSHPIDILWFSLKGAPPVRDENVFHAVVKNGNSFGFFRAAQGDLQLGWGLHKSDGESWKERNWSEVFAQHSPDWLAAYFRENSSYISAPLKFSVTVGLASRWSRPGFLLLGDAAHPMSPIRAQGINMALRDALVAAAAIAPVFNACDESRPVNELKLDRAIATIQENRQPEIVRAQQLQKQELFQGELLRRYPVLRWGASQFAPAVGWGVKRSWLRRQRDLRLGIGRIP